MNALEALAILEAAVLECERRNINTTEVRDALNVLEPHTRPPLPVLRFRSYLDGARDIDKKDQQQVLRVAFPAIRESVRVLLGKQIDSLTRHYTVSRNMRVKDEIERLAREHRRLGEPWASRHTG